MMKRHRRPETVALDPLEYLPAPPDYDRAPELGVLAALLSILDVAFVALLATNRDLLDDERPSWVPLSPTAPAADKLLNQIDRLRRAVQAYRSVALPPPLPAEPAADDDIPF
jgi:hypothetical protein